MNAVNKQHVQLPRTLDTEQLAQLQAQGRQKLLEGVYTGYQWVYPCAEKQSFHSFQQALEVTQAMAKEGRELYPHDFPEHSGLYYAASYWRTSEEIEAILTASDLEVEAQYKFELEEFNQAQISLLADQLYQAQKNKEEKIQREKEEKAKAKALEEAQAFINQQLKEVK